MSLNRINKRRLIRLLPFIGVLLLGFSVTFIVTAAGRDSSYYYLKRAFDMDDIGVKHPAGLAYSPTDNVFIVFDEADNGRDVALISPSEQLTGAISLPDIAVSSQHGFRRSDEQPLSA